MSSANGTAASIHGAAESKGGPMKTGISKEHAPAFEKKTYNLPSVLTDQFPELALKVGAASDTEIVKNAIRLYIFLHQIMEDGDSLQVRKADGREVEIGLFL